MQANSCFILIGAHVVYGWLILDNWLLLISSQVEYLWFQQKQVEALGTDILVYNYAALFLQQLYKYNRGYSFLTTGLQVYAYIWLRGARVM